jgi:hypothetical protein
MDYQKIHDSIIDRAKKRVLSQEQYAEKHHLLPKCEGGSEDGETVLLTHKEHKTIHKLRYKITKNVGNLLAYNFMSNSVDVRRTNSKIAAKLGAKAYHTNYKEQNPKHYSKLQSNSGRSGGMKCVQENLGFFKISEEEKKKHRMKGVETIVQNKIGMFSDDFRQKHRLTLMKKIKTPDGVFDSITDASKYYGITLGAMTYRLKNEKWNEWVYLNNEGVLK